MESERERKLAPRRVLIEQFCEANGYRDPKIVDLIMDAYDYLLDIIDHLQAARLDVLNTSLPSLIIGKDSQ